MAASSQKLDSEIDRIDKLAKKLVHELSDCRLRAANNLLTKFQRKLIDVSLFSSNLSFGRQLAQRINDALCLIINDAISTIEDLPDDDIACINSLLQLIALMMNSSREAVVAWVNDSAKKGDPLPILLENLYKIKNMKGISSTTRDYLSEVCSFPLSSDRFLRHLRLGTVASDVECCNRAFRQWHS